MRAMTFRLSQSWLQPGLLGHEANFVGNDSFILLSNIVHLVLWDENKV
jgi:hypothetical protein